MIIVLLLLKYAHASRSKAMRCAHESKQYRKIIYGPLLALFPNTICLL